MSVLHIHLHIVPYKTNSAVTEVHKYYSKEFHTSGDKKLATELFFVEDINYTAFDLDPGYVFQTALTISLS